MKNFYIETYGCQMNFSDSEIAASVMKEAGFVSEKEASLADIIFINTCSIREHAEQRIRKRIKELHAFRKKKPHLIIGILGCMAERLKGQLLEEEKSVNLIVGPDAYRNLPDLVETAFAGEKAIDVILSSEETYSDISPVKLDNNGVSAFISIMRGCVNYCSYCVVPYTRGKERSRETETILREASELFKNGYREITLLGQNVNSYFDKKNGLDFPGLIEKVAQINSLLRVRFATSHPKDISDRLLLTMAKYPNICKTIHLPVQSGSTHILELMNRKYTREWYMERISAIRKYMPDCAISTDIITGFCGENEVDHQETLSLMEWAKFDFAYMFKYSERPNTKAAEKYKDDVPEEIKSRRLKEIIDLQQKISLVSNKKDIGKVFEVLAENVSKRSAEHLAGRNSQNKVVIFPRNAYKPGDYVHVKIIRCTSATLIGELL